MQERLWVEAREGLAAAAAGRGFAWHFLIGGQQGAVVRIVSGLGATATLGGLTRRRALDVKRITGRGAGGILRVLVETCVEIGNLLTQGGDFLVKRAEEGKESGLGGG